MKTETLQKILNTIQVSGFALVVLEPEPNHKQPWAYTVGLFSKEGLDCELVFTEQQTSTVYIDLIDLIVGLASDGEIAFEAIYDIAGYLFMLRKYEDEEYIHHPIAAASEYFNVHVPAVKVIVLDLPR